MKNIVLLLTFSISGSVFARDSIYFSCSGLAPLANEADKNIGLAVDFLDFRSVNDRDEQISVVYQGNLFQGIYHGSAFKGENAPITLADKSQPNHVLFKGTYSLVPGTQSNYTLSIEGQISEDPSDPNYAFLSNFS